MVRTSQTRRMLVVVAMTTALCADQMVFATPAACARPTEIVEIAHRLVERLNEGLRGRSLAMVSTPVRSHTQPAAPELELQIQSQETIAHPPITPFQFRLPPPIV
ncbi:MAG TPA: hypothetical protein VFW23_01155 [Tepidisphaeraceae bacterium]|nr:hypothetical protein [Tepidisphaeraceae bacterium]